MKNHYLKVIVGSILLITITGSFNYKNSRDFIKNINTEIKEPLYIEPFIEEEEISKEPEKEKSVSGLYFATNTQEAQIGITEEKLIDNPIDNIFHVKIEKGLTGKETVWLEYDLKGIQDFTGISRSINDQLAFGGYLVRKSDEWVKQKERLNPNNLIIGDNIIRFTTPENVEYAYQIRNLSIRVEPYNEIQSNSERRLIVNQPSSEYYYGKLGYLQGYVIGDNSEEAKVFVNGEKIRYQKGSYESLVEKPLESTENWSVRVQAVFPDGQELYVDVPFNKPSEWDYTNGFDKEIHSTEQLVSNTESFELQLANAKLEGDSGCIDRETNLSITALRDIDVPALDAGMVNVTAGFKGYRFLPHGTMFNENVFVELGYDTTKIPQGYTVHDIKTYFFDETNHHWVALPKDSLLLADNSIRSVTNHFTDMINGIIKVPESPETQAYVPTSMKDVKAANPAAGINLIEAPTANSTGSANLSYPLNIPAGRQGMQPQLAISYNSGGGNGWLGLGWDLSVPSISVDTRWGVPHYAPNKESETYLMNGEQMSPVTHRDEWRTRESEKRFYPRVEGSFSKIIRHGNDPSEYWWEVTSKDGIKYFYGADSNGDIVSSAVLTDPNGNIARWELVEIRDLNDNFINYSYTTVMDAGIKDGTVPGYQLYIDKITYTGHGDNEGIYNVEFIRDRQDLGNDFEDNKRKDISINGRYGFKEVTADKLSKIIVSIADTVIRSYKLEYDVGAYSKTLLSKITEFDPEGNEFNSHSFDYYDNTFSPLGNEEIWDTKQDNRNAGFFLSSLGFEDQASAISGNLNQSGAINENTSFAFSTSGQGNGFNYEEKETRGLVKLIDVNGDGLPDKLMKKGDSIYYRPQIIKDGITSFGEDFAIKGDVSNFLYEKGYTHEFVFEFNNTLPFTPSGGVNISGVESKTRVYLTDVNADGFIDIVKYGVVYYNHCDENGNITFLPSSEGTPNQISDEGEILESVQEAMLQQLSDLLDYNPIYDAVKYWLAPYDGKISINAPIQLNPSGRRAKDGVYVSVQHNAMELWRTTIEGDNNNVIEPVGVENLLVNKGDRIYFRVQSRSNHIGDVVSWNPEITYDDQDIQHVDPNNKAFYKFNSSEDFLLSYNNILALPYEGAITIKSALTKPVLSDDIDIIILKNDVELSTLHLNWDETYNDSLNWEIDVDADDKLKFLINSETNVRWEDINWYPQVNYNSVVEDTIWFDKDQKADIIPNMSVYPGTFSIAQKYTPYIKDTIKILPYINNTGGNYNIHFSIKSNNRLIYKDKLLIKDSLLVDTIELIIDNPDDLFFEFFTPDIELAKLIDLIGVSLKDSASIKDITAGLYSSIEDDKKMFGCLYRNWGQFVYDGSDERELEPINENYLVLLTQEQVDSRGDEIMTWIEEFDTNDEISADINFDRDIFIPMIPIGSTKVYKGVKSNSTIGKETFSSSMLRYIGEQDISEESNPRAVSKSNNSLTKTKYRSVRVGILSTSSIGESKSKGYNKTFSDFMDMNGDRYPDIIAHNLIQYSNQEGGLSNKYSTLDDEIVHFSKFDSDGKTVGSGCSKHIKQCSSSSSNSSFSLSTSLGISGNVGDGSSTQEFSWFDMNGDGLLDKVYATGEVELNFGYSFGEAELWNFNDIRIETNTSENASISGGISAGYKKISASFSGGTGLSKSKNKVSRQFSDMNNDGLLDIVLLFEDKIYVKFNTGNHFTIAKKWFNEGTLEKSETVSQNYNLGGSFAVSINAAINISTSISDVDVTSIHRQEVLINDVDGDGFPDYLKSDKDSELKVKRSTIGKTNLLKSVKRPLKANFELAYEKVGNTFEMPQATWALSEVKIYDGHQGDGANYMKTSFKYEAGYQDRHEREFYGFKTVKTNQLDTENNDAVYRTIVKEFANDSYYTKGLLLSETIQDANENKFIETVNEYKLKNRATMQDFPDDFEEQGINIALPVLVETNKYFYEGNQQAQKSTKMTFAYGDYGNVVAYTDYGDPDVDEDNISSSIDYWDNLSDKNVLNVPKSIVVTGGDGKTYRKRETSIDEDGKITQIRQYLKSGQPAVYDIFYDDYGNLDSVIRPANYNGERMYFAYDYDNVVNSYVTNIRDAYGYSSSTTYDYRFGQVLSTTDMNGQRTLYEIDNLGRITKITGPYELESGQDYTLRFAYYPDATIPWAKTQHYDPAHPTNPIETALFIDGLGRVLQTKKDGAIFNGTDANDQEVMLVSGKVVFDAFGRAIQSYYPVKENKGSIGTFNTTIDGVTPTKVTYDILDRTKTTSLPDGALTKITYGFGEDRLGYLQYMTTVKDAENKETVSYTDVKGLQTAIKAPGDVWTSFVYNSINELKEVTDAEDNITVSEYDMFGRRASRDHPDAGLTEYTYDLSGNMLTQVTANLRKEHMEISYEYEYSRLNKINYPQNPENNVRFEYGAPDSDYNRAGRIVVQEDATGAQEFFYGNLGEITKNIRTIIVPDDGIFTFVTEWKYDTWNRLTSMIYPDGEELIYEYNTGGLLRSMFGKKDGHRYNYLNQLGYDKFEDRVYLAYGNGTETTYDYETNRRRLHNITATTSAGRQMMNNTYTYDNVNNIVNLKNEAPIPTDGLKGGSSEYNYVYDDLYRLDYAEGIWHGESHEHQYTLDMEYSTTGSIVQKSQTHDRRDYDPEAAWVKQNKTTYDFDYKYESGQAHAPSKIGNIKYTYDDNGNQEGWQDTRSNKHREIIWDEENRIRAIADNGTVNHYIYDAAGERVIKSNGDGQVVLVNGFPMGGKGTTGNYTMYVNPFMVVNSMKFTKHFYIEGQRIVSKLGDMGKNQDLLNPKDTIKAGNNGNHPIDWDNKHENLKDQIIENFEELGLTGAVFTAGKSGKIPYGQIKKYYRNSNGIIDGYGSDSTSARNYDGNKAELLQFYYHPDHLGSSNFITDVSGEVYQHMEYFPFGETFIEERNGTDYTNYLYNGKELDEETGLYYYGARYYDPRISMFYGVDPFAEERLWLSPYNYCSLNPLNRIDPDGALDDWVEGQNGDIRWDENVTSANDVDLQAGDTYLGKEGYGVNETTGAAIHYKSDGTTSESSFGIGEATVTGEMSDHARTMSNPIVQAVHQGQNDFLSHPVTKATVNTLLFVATGGIEGLTSLGSAGARLFTSNTSNASRVFWSGGGNPAVQEAAKNFAIKNSMTTLEMTTKGKILTGLTNTTSYNFTKPLWQRASTSFAKGASGTVNVFQNVGGINIKSVWGNVEYQILKTKGVDIIYHIVP